MSNNWINWGDFDEADDWKKKKYAARGYPDLFTEDESYYAALKEHDRAMIRIKWLKRRFRRAFRDNKVKLTPLQHEAVRLAMAGFSQWQSAIMMNVSQQMISKHLGLATKKFRQYFKITR